MEQPEMLMETAANPHVHQSNAFDAYALRGYSLHWLCQEGLVVCSLHNAMGECDYLEEFASSTDTLTSLRSAIAQHDFLGKNVWKNIVLTINNQSFTQIPNAIFRKEYTARYLQLAKGKLLDHTETLITTPIAEADLINVFSVNKQLNDWLADMYPFQEIEVKHQTSELIKATIKSNGLQGIIYFEQDNFTLVIAEDGKLQFCNRFAYKTPQDLTYYLLFVMNEMSILPAGMPLIIFGEIDETSEEFWEMKKYFSKTIWGKSTHTLNFEGVLNHRFFQL